MENIGGISIKCLYKKKIYLFFPRISCRFYEHTYVTCPCCCFLLHPLPPPLPPSKTIDKIKRKRVERVHTFILNIMKYSTPVCAKTFLFYRKIWKNIYLPKISIYAKSTMKKFLHVYFFLTRPLFSWTNFGAFSCLNRIRNVGFFCCCCCEYWYNAPFITFIHFWVIFIWVMITFYRSCDCRLWVHTGMK